MFYSILCYFGKVIAIRTGLEPATSAVTGRHSNQLNYRINFFEDKIVNLCDPDGTRTRDLRRDRAAF